jgi:hypothetical protein
MVVFASGDQFGITLSGGTLWTADYKNSLVIPIGGAAPAHLRLPVHPFWLAPGVGGTLLTAAEGDAEDTDPGAVFSYDGVKGTFTTLARPRDPDQELASGHTILVASHGDREVLAIDGGAVQHWSRGASVVAIAAEPNLGLLLAVVNSHE